MSSGALPARTQFRTAKNRRGVQRHLQRLVRRLTSALFPALFRTSGFACSFPFSSAVPILRSLALWAFSIFVWHRYHLLSLCLCGSLLQPNGSRYPLVGGTRQRHFDGTNSKPRKPLENAQTPTSRVHAVLGGGWRGADHEPSLYGFPSQELVHSVKKASVW